MITIKTKAILFFSIINFALAAQGIRSGPMLGYSEMREVLIWVQTKAEVKVKAKYWIKSNPKQFFYTDELSTTKTTAYTAKLIADQVMPDNTYDYEIWINGKKENATSPQTFQSKKLWLWRKDAPDFKFALGSCAYVNEPQFDRPGEGYGGNYEIYTSIYNKKDRKSVV